MNQLIKWIKNFFSKKPLALNGAKERKEIVDTRDMFLESLKVENNGESISVLQIRFEEGIIKEESLTTKQISQIKDLYCSQIGKLNNLINGYKEKLN